MRKNKKIQTIVFLSFLLSLSWSWIFFIDATKITSSSFVAGLTAIVSFALTVGLSVTIFYLGTRYLYREYKKQKKPSPLLLFKVFVVWAFLEWLVALAIGLLWAGRNSSLDTVVPFGSLTPILMYTPLGLLTRFLGYHGLSALVATLFVALIAKPYRRHAAMIASIMVVLSASSWFIYKTPNGRPADVLIVSEKLGEPQKITTDAELIVMPEYGLDNVTDETISERIDSTSGNNVAFVGSKQYSNEKGVQNVLIFGSTKTGLTKEQAKTRLVPAGEYLPYSVEFLLRATQQTGILAEFEFSRAVVRGNESIKPFYIDKELVVGAEACSSIIAAEDYRKLVNQGATLLTNSASLEIFSGSAVFTAQHKGMARFMATANTRPLIQSAMDGPAFVLDHNGKLITETLPVSTQQVDIHTNTKRTPYSILGDWAVLIGWFVLVLPLLWKTIMLIRQSWYTKLKYQNKKDNHASKKSKKAK